MKMYLKLLINLILLPLICVIFIQIFKLDIGYEVFAFSIFIVVFNFNKIKIHFFKSLILSVTLSFITFFGSIGLYFSFGYVTMLLIDLDNLNTINFLGLNVKNLFYIFPVSVISPLLMFYSYSIIFQIKKNNYYRLLVKFIVLLLTITTYMSYIFYNDFKEELWQLIMALSLQLLIYQNELKDLITNRIKYDR